MLIWRDANRDGKSDAEELVPLVDAGIVSLSLQAKPLAEQKRNDGNKISASSDATTSDGKTLQTYDIWFDVP